MQAEQQTRDQKRSPGPQTSRIAAGARLPGQWMWCCGGLVLLSCLPTCGFSQDTPDYYRQNCMNCHTIGGGRLTGPDLKDVTQRKDAEWLINFMQNPRAVVDSGDAYAAKLLEESRGVMMPVAPGMTRYRAEQLIKLIEAESKLEKSQFQGVKISTKPFTDQDRVNGQRIFTGLEPLKNGGTACNGCHSMYDLPALGGGQLGPDLTRVYERLKGRQALGAWLMAPATETMQPIFRNHPLDEGEIHALTAYFEAGAEHSEAETAVNRTAFLLLGLGVASAVIFLFDVIWKGRFYGVRRPLVDAGRRLWRSPSGSGSVSHSPARTSIVSHMAGEPSSPGGHA